MSGYFSVSQVAGHNSEVRSYSHSSFFLFSCQCKGERKKSPRHSLSSFIPSIERLLGDHPRKGLRRLLLLGRPSRWQGMLSVSKNESLAGMERKKQKKSREPPWPNCRARLSLGHSKTEKSESLFPSVHFASPHFCLVLVWSA